MNIKRKIITISVFFGALFLSLAFFVIIPAIKEIRNLSLEYKNTQKEIFNLENEFLTIQKIEKDYEEFLKDYEEKIENFFIDSEIPVGFINFLEKIASSSDVLIKISSFSSTKEKNTPLGYTNIQINAEGELEKLLQFLEKIEKNDYFVETQNLSIKKVSTDKVNFTILIKVLAR